jgi:hypothetical protein
MFPSELTGVATLVGACTPAVSLRRVFETAVSQASEVLVSRCQLLVESFRRPACLRHIRAIGIITVLTRTCENRSLKRDRFSGSRMVPGRLDCSKGCAHDYAVFAGTLCFEQRVVCFIQEILWIINARFRQRDTDTRTHGDRFRLQ